MYRILVINPGSTSTKAAVFEDDRQLCGESISHSAAELGGLDIPDQAPLRRAALLGFLAREGIEISSLSAVVGRGGILPPVSSGAYLVDDALLDALKYHSTPHASNLGGVLAAEIAAQAGVNAYIYDSIAVDELDEVDRKSVV